MYLVVERRRQVRRPPQRVQQQRHLLLVERRRRGRGGQPLQPARIRRKQARLSRPRDAAPGADPVVALADRVVVPGLVQDQQQRLLTAFTHSGRDLYVLGGLDIALDPPRVELSVRDRDVLRSKLLKG